MDQDTLQKLYGWFEQLIELPPDQESFALRSLRKDHPTLVLHLECLLASARNATRTSAAFDVQDILDAAQQTSRSDDLSQNIEQLARELQCDPVHQVYRVFDCIDANNRIRVHPMRSNSRANNWKRRSAQPLGSEKVDPEALCH